jgi:hypothetical protein
MFHEFEVAVDAKRYQAYFSVKNNGRFVPNKGCKILFDAGGVGSISSPHRAAGLFFNRLAKLRLNSARLPSEFLKTDNGCSLSPRERVRVRGNATQHKRRLTFSFRRPRFF